MQCAFSSISCGMPLSGVAMTSENTAADSSNRFADSLSMARSGATARAATIMNFIFSPLLSEETFDSLSSASASPSTVWRKDQLTPMLLSQAVNGGSKGVTLGGHVTGYGQASDCGASSGASTSVSPRRTLGRRRTGRESLRRGSVVLTPEET